MTTVLHFIHTLYAAHAGGRVEFHHYCIEFVQRRRMCCAHLDMHCTLAPFIMLAACHVAALHARVLLILPVTLSTKPDFTLGFHSSGIPCKVVAPVGSRLTHRIILPTVRTKTFKFLLSHQPLIVNIFTHPTRVLTSFPHPRSPPIFLPLSTNSFALHSSFSYCILHGA